MADFMYAYLCTGADGHCGQTGVILGLCFGAAASTACAHLADAASFLNWMRKCTQWIVRGCAASASVDVSFLWMGRHAYLRFFEHTEPSGGCSISLVHRLAKHEWLSALLFVGSIGHSRGAAFDASN